MQKNRMEAFTDGVVAIIITIVVLELKVPEENTLKGLAEVAPIFLVYALSFLNVGLYWNNHHHMLHAANHIDGRVLWANLFLLFWLSLTPFAIRWMDEAHFAAMPTAFYGVALLMAGVGYSLLTRALIACNKDNPVLARAIGSDWKGWLSVSGYLIAIPMAFAAPWVSIAVYVAIAVSWFIPDRRIERVLAVPPPRG